MLKRLVQRWRAMPHPSHASPAYLFADLSSNNGANAYNAAAYAKAGHLLIGLKATEGVGYVNPYYHGWAAAAHANRTAVLHYHFCDMGNPVAEAHHFWTIVKPNWKNGDRLAIDIETKLSGNAAAWLAEFDGCLKAQSGIEATGYTFRSALDSYGLKVRSGKWWVASYGGPWPAGPFRRLPRGETMWAYQYTNGVDGIAGPRTLTGIAGRCDVSVLSPPIVTLLQKTLKR